MKKIIGFILCAMMVCAMPVVAYAEGDSVDVPAIEEEVQENVPTEEETVTEGEVPAPEEQETVTEPEEKKTMTEVIVDYVKSHFEELSVIGTLLLTIFYEIRKHGKLNGSIGTLNNNSVTIAKNSAEAIKGIADNSEAVVKDVLAKAQGVAAVVENYADKMEAMLGEIRKNAEESQALKETLAKVDAHLKTTKLANVEFANELAELLSLSNIPNSKKEELYSRHRAAVANIAEAENTEVKEDDGQEA